MWNDIKLAYMIYANALIKAMNNSLDTIYNFLGWRDKNAS